VTSSNTKIKFMTDGLLLREAMLGKNYPAILQNNLEAQFFRSSFAEL
jgi:hypothetical protein